MVYHLTTVGAVHAGLAMAGIVIGLIQFLQVKGTRVHRALGYAYAYVYVYVYGMLVADGTALLIQRSPHWCHRQPDLHRSCDGTGTA